MKITGAVVFLVAALGMTPALAQDTAADKPADNMQILREKLKADKKLVVAANMQLTEAEAKGFWPVYEAYQKDLEVLNKRMTALVRTYADAWNAKAINNEVAKRLTADLLEIQADEVKHMQSYVPALEKVLPATQVARYLQIENKIRSIIKYDLAGQVPLMPGN